MGKDLNLKVSPSDPCELDFAWYTMIRDELLRKTVAGAQRVLDIGCGRGDVLRMLSRHIGRGVGIDTSEEAIAAAEAVRRKKGITNLRFRHANALKLPFPPRSFDAVLCLGDVSGYANLYGQQDRLLAETKRVLKDDGLTVHDCMNWDWEYRLSPYWTFLTRTKDGRFFFHRARRTAVGRETCRTYEVLPETSLSRWIREQKWPVSPTGQKTSLDVIEQSPIPRRWLTYEGVSSHQRYTPRSLKRRFARAGFRDVEVLPYGQTYDIASKAGLLGTLRRSRARLARAEAAVILQQRTGSGPWLFLTARK